MDRVIRSAVPSDTKPAAAMLARAFADDPLLVWVLPDEAARRRRLPELFAAQLRAAARGPDETDLILADGRPLGCAMWAPPGACQPSLRQQLPVLAVFPLIMRRRLAVAVRSFNALGRERPEEPHWYLSTIGVDPAAQRTGVARGLLAPRLARCDEDQIAAALVTGKESNVAYYESFGFTVTGHIEVPGGGPAHWAMWRNPRQ
ncbi:MAG TPA: GNAT family N-acetyltransferase [Streptosporangiaceae bacterium]|nr:GNAT family N-acetyltransferase [Streptosporangiaceae bacterium]